MVPAHETIGDFAMYKIFLWPAGWFFGTSASYFVLLYGMEYLGLSNVDSQGALEMLSIAGCTVGATLMLHYAVRYHSYDGRASAMTVIAMSVGISPLLQSEIANAFAIGALFFLSTHATWVLKEKNKWSGSFMFRMNGSTFTIASYYCMLAFPLWHMARANPTTMVESTIALLCFAGLTLVCLGLERRSNSRVARNPLQRQRRPF
jgi:hypothetical protein